MKKTGCDCPMTIENCEKYGVTNNQQKNFCKAGCSVICEKEFVEQFIKRDKPTAISNLHFPLDSDFDPAIDDSDF